MVLYGTDDAGPVGARDCDMPSGVSVSKAVIGGQTSTYPQLRLFNWAERSHGRKRGIVAMRRATRAAM